VPGLSQNWTQAFFFLSLMRYYDGYLFPAIKCENNGSAQPDQEESTGGGVDIEALVDQCFQEELANRQQQAARSVPPSPADPKPVLAVKPLMRTNTSLYNNCQTGGSYLKGQSGTVYEPGEVRPEDLPFVAAANGLPGAGGASRLRAYRRPSLAAAAASGVGHREPGEIVTDLEPGEIRPPPPTALRLLSTLPEPGEILPSDGSNAYALEPGEIPPETAEETVLCFDQAATSRPGEHHNRAIFVENSSSQSRGELKALAGVPLHNIAIASPALSLLARKSMLLPSTAAASSSGSMAPPQRQFSVIQRRIPSVLKPEMEFSSDTEVLDIQTPAVSLQSDIGESIVN
jgi:hypothetical protein